MPDVVPIQEKQAKFELVLTARQVVKVQCLICGLLCLVSATSYLVALSNTKVEAASRVITRTVEHAKPVEVHPVAASSPNPAPAPVAKEPEPLSAVTPRLPIQGQTYFQMAAVERGVAEVFVEYLGRKGFAALMAPGPSDSIFRVLVGPIDGPEAFSKTQADLIAAGFTTFTRRFKQGETPVPSPKPESE